MLRAPPPNRKINQRHIQKGKNPEQGAKERTFVRLFKHGAQQQVRGIQQPEYEGESQTRIPGPPDSPHRVRPDRPSDQHDGNEHQAHFCGGNAQPVPLGLARKYVSQIRVEANPQRDEGAERAREVQVEDLLDWAHGLLNRCVIESQICCEANHQEQNHCAKNGFQHREPPSHSTLSCHWDYMSLIPPRDTRRKAIAPSKKRRQIQPESRASLPAAPASLPTVRLSPPCWQLRQASAAAAAVRAA